MFEPGLRNVNFRLASCRLTLSGDASRRPGRSRRARCRTRGLNSAYPRETRTIGCGTRLILDLPFDRILDPNFGHIHIGSIFRRVDHVSDLPFFVKIRTREIRYRSTNASMGRLTSLPAYLLLLTCSKRFTAHKSRTYNVCVCESVCVCVCALLQT